MQVHCLCSEMALPFPSCLPLNSEHIIDIPGNLGSIKPEMHNFLCRYSILKPYSLLKNISAAFSRFSRFVMRHRALRWSLVCPVCCLQGVFRGIKYFHPTIPSFDDAVIPQSEYIFKNGCRHWAGRYIEGLIQNFISINFNSCIVHTFIAQN